MKINLFKFSELQKRNYVSIRQHNSADLLILNYTAKCQYDKYWTEETLMCRGLITDLEGDVKARPFKKFFNLQEVDEIPDGDFHVYEKYDGSLGILYWIEDKPYLATRGSFMSDQAIKGTEMLKTYDTSKLDRTKTYLFEIIYSDNRIVVDYKGEEKLVLLAIIDTETGKEHALESDVFETAKLFDGLDLEGIKAMDDNVEDEGFVLKWPNGYRLKYKFSEYIRLHRLLTQCTARSIWDLMRLGRPLDELLERVPDEFYQWVRAKKHHFINEFDRLMSEAEDDFKKVKNLPRKEAALYLVDNSKVKHLVFSLMDGKDIEGQIWKMLYPSHEVPFKTEN